MQIEPTKDENSIKQAYRMLLSAHNPEEDPEGFKKLRSAFEVAQQFARSNEELEDVAAETDSDNPIQGQSIYGISVSEELLSWMQELMRICHSRHRRLDADEWIRMLRADVFHDLEEGENAEKVFFFYLSENYNHPSYIYRAIDQMTSFSVRQKELAEFLPQGFIEYMNRKAQDEEGDCDFPFDWFDGPDDADVEQFIRDQFELESLMMQGEFAKAREQASSMEKYQLNHPHYEMEIARLEQEDGNHEPAADRARRIMQTHPDSVRLALSGAEVLYKCGCKEEAHAVYERLSDENLHPVIQYRLAQAAREQGKLVEAIKHCCVYLDYHYDAALYELADELYKEVYDTYYAKRPKLDLFFKLDDRQQEILLDAFLHLMKCEEGLAYVKANKKKLDGQTFTHRYVGRYHFFLKEYDQAEQYCMLWRKALSEEPESKEQKRMLARSYSYEAQVYFAQAEAIGPGKDMEARKHQKELCQQAEQAIRQGIQIYDALIYKRLLGKILILAQKGEEAVKLLEEVSQENPHDYTSKIVLQEAYEEAGDPNGVLDIYQEFLDLKIPAAEVYERAAKLFIAYHRPNDADKVLKAAKELEISTPRIALLELQILCCSEDPVAAEKEARLKLREIENAYMHDPEKMPEEIVAKAYFEIAILLDMVQDEGSLDAVTEKMRYMRLALKHYETLEYCYTYGRFLLLDGKYTDCLEWLKKAELECEGHYRATNIYEHIGYAYGALDDPDRALSYYEKVLQVDPDHRQVHGRIGKIYTNYMIDTRNRMYAKKALFHVTEQLKHTPESGEDLENLYKIYRQLREYEKAFEAAQKLHSLYYSRNTLYWVVQAKMRLERYEEAIAEWGDYLNSLESDEQRIGDYLLAGDICERMGDSLNAIYWYEKGQLLVRERDTTFLDRMADVYHRDGNWEKLRRMIMRMSLERDSEAVNLAMIAYQQASTPKEIRVSQQKMKALLLKLRVTEKRADADLLEDMAECYLYGLNDHAHAKEYYEKAILYRKSRGHSLDNLKYGGYGELLRLMYLAHLRGAEDAVKQYGRQYIELMEYEYGNQDPDRSELELYLDDTVHEMYHLYDLAEYDILMGNMEAAEGIVERLKKKRKCDYCMYCMSPECTDAIEIQAYLLEMKGETQQALPLYERAYEVDKSNLFALWRMRVLKGQI